ncbi:MAG: type II secretion system minor pseudopilin GspJ [Gammaproteobacteria bacterium]|nr:type II secretion system minor pseudopilin GspJ [Gammaproteobacteria bacterium]MCW8841731.1 type II secretion system minor pseudopilin GspJ [Gammaproteobacteria bacterium]MCW8927524.1 type II secretion system minor pseudopilin GspJ [Gammaproteobacteria bacterium]MCW8958247.1 type II secretion system minor pseudopilin GspJ [Gammaproteobacteria bacterium]MCW8973551.1 type II secretion system minor pseudopilin GspJ [Gammaproteobacteria bacterium]
MVRQRGFTLLEMLVAVAVFAAVSAVAYGGLSSMLQTRQQVGQHAQRLQSLQQTMAIMHRDLTQALVRPVRDPFGDVEPALYQQEGVYLLVLTRAGRLNLQGLRRSELQRIAYALEDGRLIRYVWPVLDSPQGSEPYSHVLLEAVREVELRFVDSQREWQLNWPPLDSLREEAEVALPLAVEITLELEQWGGFRRLIPLVETAAVVSQEQPQ